MTAALLLLALSPARAESAWVPPKGASVLYGGVGLGSFQYGSSGLLRDRQLRARIDLYGAVGLGHGLQLSFDAPLVHTWVREIDGRGPCPRGDDDYCDPVTTAGEAGLHLRWQAVDALTFGLGARSDAWNAGTRHRWTNAGLGTTSLVGSVLTERSWGAGWGAVAWAHYGLVFGRDVLGERLPADLLTGGVSARRQLGAATLELTMAGYARLGGVEYADWVGTYSATDERWAALAYRDLSGRLKCSLPLGERAGLHVSLGRVLVAANGPKDAADLSIGVHRYTPPRGERTGGPED